MERVGGLLRLEIIRKDVKRGLKRIIRSWRIFF